MRKNIVAGNWKMNLGFDEAEDLIDQINEELETFDAKPTIILCPSYPYLELTSDMAEEGLFSCGAQNVAQWNNGAYTGEISAQMLDTIGVEYCIVGHSERRKYFKETSEEIAHKVDRLMENDIIPIFCCGEALEQREAGNHFEVVENQIKESLFHLSEEQILDLVIAYEPVWAIGTGKTATSQQAQEMHAHIRSLLEKKYSKEIAQEISILYGGSCNSKNAKELFANKDVDGGLIGGASLKKDDFIAIVKSF
jgi:triosephosphate isomerase